MVFHARASDMVGRSSVEIHLNQFVRALAVEMDVCQGLELSYCLMRRIEDGCHQKKIETRSKREHVWSEQCGQRKNHEEELLLPAATDGCEQGVSNAMDK